ncbi:MAG: stage V sporulation protein AC [Clostridia bacterium]|nr:stage V sporulation protein AC [Clostridia bacterium]
MKQKSPAAYDRMVKKASPPSPLLKDCLFAFLFGGAICTLAQILANLYISFGIPEKDAKTLVSVTLIFLSASLTAAGKYDDIAKHAGAGLLVPITGFANSVSAPAMEFKSEGFITGMAVKMFVISGPVIVYGIVSSAIYGVIYRIITLFTGG